MLLFWSLFAAGWIEDLLASWSKEGRPDLVHVYGVLLCSLGALGTLYILAWEIFGEQVVTLSEGKFTVSLHLRWWQRVRAYASGEVNNLRVQSAFGLPHSLPFPLPYPGWELSRMGGIAFDYRGRTITFGFGVSRAKARRIVAVIAQARAANAS